MAVPVVAHADHGAIQRIHSREQSGSPVTLVIVSHGPATPLLQRQSGLGAVERLDLTLFIRAQHDGVFRRVEVKTNDGLQFFGELRIVADLERARQMRLQTVLTPDPTHALFAKPSGLDHAACAPVCGVAGLVLRRLPDHFLDLGRRDRRCSSRSRRVFIERRHTAVQKPVPPARCLLRHDSQLGRDLLILHAGCGQ